MKKLILSSIILLALTACSDPKKPNETNFKNAINEYLTAAYPECYIKDNYPLEYDQSALKYVEIETLDMLVSENILNKTNNKRIEKENWSGKEKEITTVVYDLTEEGKKYYTTNATKDYRGQEVGGFCFGTASVDSINNFTEPSDAFGMTISQVKYSYKVNDIPKWIKAEKLPQKQYKLKADSASVKTPIETKATLILTNNGWVHEKLFKK